MAARRVRTHDVELWTEDFGAPTDPDLLLIMGANASAMGWPDELVVRLAAGGTHVVRYDHRDTGQSTHRSFDEHPYTVATLAQDALHVLDGHGIAAAHLVGFSMGATLAQALAVDHPTRVLSLTLICGAALDVDFAGNVGRALQGGPSADGLPLPDRAVLERLARRAEPAATPEEELDRRVEEWRLLAGEVLHFDAAEFRRLEEKELAHAGSLARPGSHGRARPIPTARGAELGAIEARTLVVQAMCDPLNPPPHGRHLASLIPNATYAEVPGMGHALPAQVHAPLADLILGHTVAPLRRGASPGHW